MLVAVRALGGLFGGTATVAAAFIVILYPQKKRGQQFAKMSACALSAFVFGPFVGGGLAQFGLRVPLYCAAGLSFLAMLLAFRFVIDPNELLKLESNGRSTPQKKRDSKLKQDKARASSTSSVDMFQAPPDNFLPWKEIRVWLICFQTMFTTLAFNGLSSLIALVLLEDRLGVVSPTDTVEMQGKKVALWIMAYVPILGATQVFIVMGLFPRMVKKMGLLQTGAIGSVVMAIALFLIPYYTHPAMVFITQVLLAFGNGLQTNVSNTYLSKFAPKGKAAKTLSYGSMADTIGNIIGPQLTQIYLIDARWPFYIASIFGLCSAIILSMLMMLGTNERADHKEAALQKKKDDIAVADLTKSPLMDKQGAAEPSTGASASSSAGNKNDDGTNDVEMNSLEQRLLTEQDQMDAMPVEQRIHPACFHTGETSKPHHLKYSTEAMSELSTFMYDELLDKQHMWGLRSGVRCLRQRSLEAHKDMLSMGIRRIPPPSKNDGDKSFREGVAVFLSETGHEDWAMLSPGIDLDSVLETFRVPH
jgi:MFS family permease